MKKIMLVLLIAICILGIWVHLCSGNRVKYPAGIDTVQSFGDGSFQISRSDVHISLFSEKYLSCIIRDVNHVQETKGKAYITGYTVLEYSSDGAPVEYNYELYVVVNTDNNTMQLCAIPPDSSAPEIFISQLDDMIENGDVIVHASLMDFFEEDQLVFRSMQQ